MVAPQGVALITIPITLPFEDGLVAQGKIFTVMFCCQLLETRLLRLLRFKFGEVLLQTCKGARVSFVICHRAGLSNRPPVQVYSVQAGVGWRTAPSGTEQYIGELNITFTCDPSSSLRLVEMAIAEFERLQVATPTSIQLTSCVSFSPQQRSQIAVAEGSMH